MSKPKVLLLGEIDHAHEAWESLSSLAELVKPESTDPEGFKQECKDGKLDGVVAAYRTFSSVDITGPWDEELVKHLPKTFGMVAHNGAGYDQLTPSALTSHSILATNVPTAVDDATADTGIFLLLGALRNFNISLQTLRKQQWRGDPSIDLGHDPQGKMLGILGMGGIGRNFARKAKAFGMQLQYYNRTRLSPESEEGAEYKSFEEVLSTSDVISIHVPLNAKTKHLISTKEFSLMKKGVVIVNTARGAIIDEAALVKALDDGKVGSVGLDVYEEEPEIHKGLLENEKVLLLPHMGTWTYETQEKMEVWNIENVRKFLKFKSSGDKKDLEGMSIIGEQKERVGEIVGK